MFESANYGGNIIMNNTFNFENTALFDTIKKIREISYSSPAFGAIKELQQNLNTVREPMNGVLEASKAFQDVFKAYDFSNIEALKNMQSISKDISAAVSASNAFHLHSTMNVLKDFDFSALSSVAATSHIFDSLPDDISFDTVSELVENGEITDEDFKAEIKSTITGTENEAIKSKPSKIKKVLKTIAIKFFLFLLVSVISPVTDTVKNEIVEAFRADEFWQNTGIVDWIESWSEIGSAATEDEAKATVDESKTGNISKQKREDLLNKIEEIRKYISNAPQDENTGNLLSYLSEIEKDVNGKKYGLVFEEHREDIDEVLDTHTPVLTEETDLFIDNGGQMNFLIEGDNLASLKLLEKTHKGKIDVIYIDPPYNTGNNDFVYDDIYVDSNDMFSHSKWLSFMEKRLKIARSLLSDSGIIFISIDDNEYAVLKILCDSIFSPENFQISFHMQVRYPDKNVSTEEKTFKPLMEYVLMYSKNANKYIPNQETTDYGLEKFCYKITELSEGTHFKVGNQEVVVFKKGEWKIEKVDGCLDGLKETWVTGTIYTTMSYGKVFQSVVEPRIKTDGLCCLYKVLGRGDDGLGYRYYTGPQKLNATKGKMYSGVPLERAEIFKSGKAPKKKVPIINTYDYSADFGNIRSEGGIGFNNGKKPIKMLKQLINYHSKKDAIILDFFAGSASTGHATLSLNSEDGGEREFIVCTNNENEICHNVTYPRLQNVINGYGKKKGVPASLKYYRVDYVPITERMYYEYADELLKHIRELVELENGINFIGNVEIAIVLTDEELDDFTNNVDKYTACKKLYMGHDLLPDEEQERIIKENDIEINIIPDYYYKDLQEK